MYQLKSLLFSAFVLLCLGFELFNSFELVRVPQDSFNSHPLMMLPSLISVINPSINSDEAPIKRLIEAPVFEESFTSAKYVAKLSTEPTE